MFVKKIFGAVASCLLAGALLVGCGSSDAPQSEKKSDADKIGMIAGLNVSEEKINATIRSIVGVDLDYDVVYYDNLNAMQSGFEAGAVDEISTYKIVGDYLIARHPEFEISDKHKLKLDLRDRFCCAVKSDNQDLIHLIDGAINAMKSDGTLERLTKEYITDLKGTDEPPAVEMPHIDGALTHKVAVTGDLPPLDLIRADGTPAGFNTAVLAEIGKRISRNFELVSIESNARASALASGTVDMVFWVRVPQGDDLLPLNFDRPDGIEVSEDYFVDEIVHVGKK